MLATLRAAEKDPFDYHVDTLMVLALREALDLQPPLLA
jgi:hypothetical protein